MLASCDKTEHVTFCWRPLPTETKVAVEIVEWSPEGAGKETLLSAGHTPKVLGAPPLGLLFRILGGVLGVRSSVPQSLQGGAQLTTLSFWALVLGENRPFWDCLAECPPLVTKK